MSEENKMEQLESQVIDSVNQTFRDPGSYQAIVKWFNNTLGYGFLRIVSENRKDEDIFVHQSNIQPANSEYRSLTKGEYVSLNISDSTEKVQAVDVMGIQGGPLMCDYPRPVRKNTKRGKPGRKPAESVAATTN